MQLTKTYLALDLELFWDEHLYEARRAMDSKSDRRATAVKRVMAASVFEFSTVEEGWVATGEVASWAEYDWGDEQAMVEQLFDYLRARADITVLTFGDLGTDIPVLVLASMAHGLSLPPQLIDQPGRKGPRSHLDLCLMIRGGGRTWPHLLQVLLRMGVPAELVADKLAVSRPTNTADWAALRAHVELDCLLLALAKIAWLVAQGSDGLRFDSAAIGLIAGFVRRRPDHVLEPVLAVYAQALESSFAEYSHLAAKRVQAGSAYPQRCVLLRPSCELFPAQRGPSVGIVIGRKRRFARVFRDEYHGLRRGRRSRLPCAGEAGGNSRGAQKNGRAKDHPHAVADGEMTHLYQKADEADGKNT